MLKPEINVLDDLDKWSDRSDKCLGRKLRTAMNTTSYFFQVLIAKF